MIRVIQLPPGSIVHVGRSQGGRILYEIAWQVGSSAESAWTNELRHASVGDEVWLRCGAEERERYRWEGAGWVAVSQPHH